MKRAITEELIKWKNQYNRKPLIVRGARQVGKSWTITDFGQRYFEGQLHLINLEKRIDWHPIFDKNLDAIRILRELEIVLNRTIEIGKDLIFFDEIQACPRAISALRYFYEQLPDLHVIAAGSLLEFALSDIPFPVGRVQMLNMFPMSFSEFLDATQQERLAQIVRNKPEAQPPHIDSLLKESLKKYFLVGGMPECVQTFVATGRLADVQQVQTDLIDTYRQDFSKYTPQVDKQCLNDVLVTTANKVGQQVKYTHLSENFSSPTIKKAFDLLTTARVLHKVRTTSPAGLPLAAGASDKKFKAIFVDVGLLSRLNGLSLSVEYQKKDLLAMYQGALAEQFVGQELLATSQEALFYWARNAKSSNAEVDYLAVRGSDIVPIEVKNSTAGRLKSLHLLLATYPNCSGGVVFSDAPFGEIAEQGLAFLPLYYVGSIFSKKWGLF
ncbi:MAG: ATP-binding protein [Bacteroidota bacterium]